MKKDNHSRTILKKTPVYMGVSAALLGILIFSFFYGITFGSVEISVKEIYQIILAKLWDTESVQNFAKSTVDIVWFIRLPRIILAMAMGIGLSLCGVVMQAIVKNPLADPYILGVSSGASLGATLAIMLGVGTFLGPNYVGISAFLMAFVVALLVLTLANIKGRANATKLLLAGMSVSMLCSAFSNFIIYSSGDREGMKTVAFWLMGSLSGAKWENLITLIPVVFLATLFFISQYRTLNLMLLGDDVSVTLGKNLHHYRRIYLLVTSGVIGFLVYNAGIIGFVGLIIPHIARLLFGTDHKKIIPTSILLGAILMIWADIISRLIMPGSEIPIGIIISIIGAPSFIYLMINKTYGFGGE